MGNAPLILSTKLKNALLKKADVQTHELTISLKNITINGIKKGCYGFIKNEKNSSIVCVNTEGSCLASLNYMFRYADSFNDHRGYMNHWANSLDELTDEILQLLKKTPQEARECRI